MPLNLEPGAPLRQYRIARLLGRGGMGEVYAADDTKLGRQVAIKILPASLAHDAERLRRFTQEAKAASALNHPSILTIYDVDEVDGHPFLVTEFIDGETLRERLRQGGLTVREAIEIAGQIANALGSAHAAGIVHRDVKPENIMLREDGHAKLVDFGLAKIEQEGTATGDADETIVAVAPHTTPGLVMGTTQYMSPEQARGLKIDARSDIFSLGVVLYEMAAGRPPFQGDTPSDVIAAILHFDPPAIADAPPDLEHILRKALEKDRDERHQTAKDLAADLKRLRRRLDPAGEAARSATGQGSPSWTSTPRSGGAAATVPPPGGAPSDSAPSATRPASVTSRVVWLFVAGIAAVTAIGLVAVAGLIGLTKWLGDDNDADERGLVETVSLENMAIEKVSGLGLVHSPAISDDGKLLAYVTTESAQNAIWLRQMATGSVVRVVGPTPNTITNVEFTPDGNFLYYSENTTTRPIRYALMAAPAFGGTAREVLQGRFGLSSFSPDGKRFAVVRETPAAWELLVANADGTGTPAVIGTRPAGLAGYVSPTWSPSGTELAVLLPEMANGQFQTNIQIMNPDGSVVRTLEAPGVPLIGDLAWATGDAFVATGHNAGGIGSPMQILSIRTSDGRVGSITKDVNRYATLSFSRASGIIATVQTSQLGSIWIGPVDRPEEAKELPARLSENDGGSGLSWLNDRQLVFTRVTDFTSLWMANDDGTAARRLTEGSISISPAASRDGQAVLFASNRDTGAVPELYRLHVPDGRVTRIAPGNGAATEALSPDGRTAIFTPLFETPARLVSVATDGGGPVTTLFESPTIWSPQVSPDGTEIAAITNTGVGTVRNIVVLPIGGGEARTIYTTGAALSDVRWYPSGASLLLSITENRQTNLYRLDLAGGPARQLTRFTRGTIGNAAISPDGRRIAFYRGSSESDIVLLKPRAVE